MNNSKPLKKADESAKLFLMDILHGEAMPFMDIDLIYKYEDTRCIFELLKCESKNPHINPYTSHPHRYPKNYRKFQNLVNIKNEFKNARLFLVNYSEENTYIEEFNDYARNLVLLMEVEGFDEQAIQEWKKKRKIGGCNFLKVKNVRRLKREEFGKLLIQMNPDNFFGKEL